MQQYTQGVQLLSAGSESLYQGIRQAGAGVDQMTSSVETATAQMSASAENIGTLTSGAEQVANGMSQLQAGYQQALGLLELAQNTEDPAAKQQYLDQAAAVFNQISGSIDTLSAGASSVNEGVSQVASGIQQMQTSTGQLLTGLQQLQGAFGSDNDASTLRGGAYALNAGLNQLDQNSTALTNGAAALETGLGELDKNSTALNSGASALSQGTAALNDGVTSYTDGVSAAADGANKLHTGTTELNASTPALTNGTKALHDGAKALHEGTTSLVAGMPALSKGVKALDDGAAALYGGTSALAANVPALTDGAQRLTDGAAALDVGAAALDEGAGQLRDGLETAQTGVSDSIHNANDRLGVLDGLADYAATPVVTETQYTHPVANYGSAFSPYFMGLSLWVGGLMIFFGIYLDYNRKIKSLTKDSTRVLRQTFLFGALSVAQGLLLGLVIQFGLGIEVAHPAMLYPALVLTAWAFTAIIQFCIMHLGDIGKLVAMLLLILQLTSCGGTFPIETQAPFFQVISKFLPMTYSTQLFKEAISGSYNGNAAFSASILLAYLVGFVLLSTFCGRKAIKADVQQSVATLKEHMAAA